ncbi:MAG TPA: matrixin family metalloprotease, partial [Thermoanaerobaculia bacterium]|nr:matrixin family metalloprotease [Thermoanaerobaculia bacterium]
MKSLDFFRLAPALALLGAALPASTAAPAAATIYVMISDPVLADQAPVIALGHITGRWPAPREAATRYSFEIERVLKGEPLASTLVVHVPGGEGPDGLELVLWGAPRFAEGERALLFLEPRPDGAWAPLHLMLGAFHERRVGRHVLALRELAGAHAVADPATANGRDWSEPAALRDFAGFAEWLAARARGERAEPDYLLSDPRGDLRAVAERFNLMEIGGRNPRWTEFDDGGEVSWRRHVAGQPGLAGGGANEIGAAMTAWNGDPGTPIRFELVGVTSSANGFAGGSDGVNAILFDDPNGEVPGTFVCGPGGGGILAIAGPWTSSQIVSDFNGKIWRRIVEADLITQDGIACFAEGNSSGMAQLFTHEFGHALGLAHSCGDVATGACVAGSAADEAVMRSGLHNDRRGAKLGQDDRNAIAAVYKAAGGGGGGNDSTPPARAPLTTSAQRDFEFWVDITGAQTFAGKKVNACIAETLCVQGAVEGRPEIFAKVIGPRPNGFLLVQLVRFTPSLVEVWIRQRSTGKVAYYRLEAVPASVENLSGVQDGGTFRP